MILCSFCGKTTHEVTVLVAGPDVNICDECIFICLDVLKEKFYTDNKTIDAHENTIRIMEIGD